MDTTFRISNSGLEEDCGCQGLIAARIHKSATLMIFFNGLEFIFDAKSNLNKNIYLSQVLSVI